MQQDQQAAAEEGYSYADRPWLQRLALAAAVVTVGFHLWVAFSGLIPNLITRPAHLALAILWVFFLGIAASRGPFQRWSGWVLGAAGLLACGYIMFERGSLIRQYGALEGALQIAVALVLLATVLEMARRAIKAVLPSVALIVLLYGYFGEHIPGTFGHAGIPTDYYLGTLTITEAGLWGSLTGISVEVISLFIILGAFISAGQAGTGFMSLATQLAGRLRAGAAKVAVVSSALYGTISGVAAANTASTGMVTIPAMKKRGYPAPLAAAVEAVASTGGQIMPPIMGAGIFVMAELLRRPYTEIMVAASLPAVLFFVAAWMAVHTYALRYDLRSLTREELPGWALVVRTVPFFLVPFGILIGALAFTGYTLSYAAVFATAATWLLLFIQEGGEISLSRWWARTEKALVSGSQQVATIAAVIICAGIIVGVFNMTGLGVKLTSMILSVSGGELWAVLLLTAAASLVLGMELPTTAAYIICVAVAGPALVEVGLPELYAHLFVFWYALLCTITPPVCGNVFIAAGIARCPWLPVAGKAMQLGIGLFLVPLGFVFNPSLLQLGVTPLLALAAAVKVGLGLTLLAYAVVGEPGKLLRRLVALPAGLVLILMLGF
ncbi:TRAP transporter permease [Aquibaculum sediminis]|uniref:TRAP transporter permease n=1 Tax=Aquibaculum sediminis TaxID=3231907 RepID=UPI00345537CF